MERSPAGRAGRQLLGVVSLVGCALVAAVTGFGVLLGCQHGCGAGDRAIQLAALVTVPTLFIGAGVLGRRLALRSLPAWGAWAAAVLLCLVLGYQLAVTLD